MNQGHPLCGGNSTLLDLSEVWDTDNPAIPKCFSRSVLSLIPAILLLINCIQVKKNNVCPSFCLSK